MHPISHGPLRAAVLCSIALTALWLSPQPVCAQATYNYTGNTFTTVTAPITTSDRITATLQLSSWLPPNQTCIDPRGLPGFTLVMNDGLHGEIPPLFIFTVLVSTDSVGQIVAPYELDIGFPEVDIIREYFSLDGANSKAPCMFSGPAFGIPPAGGVGDESLSVIGSDPSFGSVGTAGVWTFPSAPALVSMLSTKIQLGTLPDIGHSIADQLQQIANDITTNNGLACQDLHLLANQVKAQTRKKISPTDSTFYLQTIAIMEGELQCAP